MSSGRSSRAVSTLSPRPTTTPSPVHSHSRPASLRSPSAGTRTSLGHFSAVPHRAHLRDGVVDGQAGEERDPRRPGCRRRHEHRHREAGARGRRPAAAEPPAPGLLVLGDDDAPGRGAGPDLVVRRAEPLEHLHGEPRAARCDRLLAERHGDRAVAHGGKARLGACPRATPTPSAAPTSRRTSTRRRRRASSPTSSAASRRSPTPAPSGRSRSSTPGASRRPANGSTACSTRGRSSRWTSTPGTGRSRSAATGTGPTATASSRGTAPSTGGPSPSSPRTSPSSAARWARSSARRSARSWTSR